VLSPASLAATELIALASNTTHRCKFAQKHVLEYFVCQGAIGRELKKAFQNFAIQPIEANPMKPQPETPFRSHSLYDGGTLAYNPSITRKKGPDQATPTWIRNSELGNKK
jgi:hypothetical protein